MPERLIPISRKQHDTVNALVTARNDADKKLSIVASTIILGVDEDIPPSPVIGARCADGVYSLVIDCPPPSADPAAT